MKKKKFTKIKKANIHKQKRIALHKKAKQRANINKQK